MNELLVFFSVFSSIPVDPSSDRDVSSTLYVAGKASVITLTRAR